MSHQLLAGLPESPAVAASGSIKCRRCLPHWCHFVQLLAAMLLLRKQDKWWGTCLLKYQGFRGTFSSVGLATSATKSLRKESTQTKVLKYRSPMCSPGSCLMCKNWSSCSWAINFNQSFFKAHTYTTDFIIMHDTTYYFGLLCGHTFE